jgi:hypothetical protein
MPRAYGHAPSHHQETESPECTLRPKHFRVHGSSESKPTGSSCRTSLPVHASALQAHGHMNPLPSPGHTKLCAKDTQYPHPSRNRRKSSHQMQTWAGPRHQPKPPERCIPLPAHACVSCTAASRIGLCQKQHPAGLHCSSTAS